MKLTTRFLLAALTGSMLLLSCTKEDTDESLNAADETFILHAALGNTAEILAGTAASSKGENMDVKSFAEMMVMDHTTAQTDLKTTGTNLGVNVPDSVDANHVALMQTMNGLSGRAFDSAYMVNQVADHQATVDAFQTELNSGSHVQVLNYANKYLPKILMHLQKADSIAKAMKFK